MFGRNRTASQSSDVNGQQQQSPRPSVGSQASSFARPQNTDDDREAKKEKRKTFLGFGRKDRVAEDDNVSNSSRPSMSSSRSANALAIDQSPQQVWPDAPSQRIVSAPIPPSILANDSRSSLDPRQRSQSMQFGTRAQPGNDLLRTSPGLGGQPRFRPSMDDQSRDQDHSARNSMSLGRPMSLSPDKPPSGNGQAGPQAPPKVMVKRPAQVFEPLMRLIALQGKKLYGASPPEIDIIPARATNGGPPKQGPPGSIYNSWDASWMQLAGTSLSVWSMKATAEANKRGERVPPTYYNVTDSCLELLAPLPPPPHTPNSRPHPFVFSLNTAGANRLLLSCPAEASLATWVTALRLASYEKSRIEEIYTGLALRTFTKGEAGQKMALSPEEAVNWNEPLSPLVKGKMEGWVRVRVMGETEWKKWWCVLSAGGPPDSQPSGGHAEPPVEKEKKRRSIFGFGGNSDHSTPPVQEHPKPPVARSIASAVFFLMSPARAKQSKIPDSNPPVLTLTHVSQAFAVFPEHLEVITSSNLLKVVGHISGEKVVVEGRNRLSAHMLIMPEAPDEASTPAAGERMPIEECLRWCVGFHDAFELYGRPERYNWQRQNPRSLFFAYPNPPAGEQLFLHPATALAADYRTDVIAANRQDFASLVASALRTPTSRGNGQDPSIVNRFTPEANAASPTQSIQQTPVSKIGSANVIREGSSHRQMASDYDDSGSQPPSSNFSLPPLSFEGSSASSPSDRPRRSETLTPITERSDVASRQASNATVKSLDPQLSVNGGGNKFDRSGSLGSKLETALVAEPLTTSPPDASELDHEEVLSKPIQIEPLRAESSAEPNGHARDLSEALQRSHDQTQSQAVSRQPTQLSKMSSPSAYSVQESPGGVLNGFTPMSQVVYSPVKSNEPQAVYNSEEGVIESGDMSRRPSDSNQPAEESIEATPKISDAVPSTHQPTILSQTPEPAPQEALLHAHDVRNEILAPTPQRASGSSYDEGHVLGDDTALLYMMSQADTKDDPTPTPNASTNTHAELSTTDSDSTLAGVAKQRPTIITSFPPTSFGPSAGLRVDGLARRPSGARAMPPKRQASTSSASGSAPPVNDEPVPDLPVKDGNLPAPPDNEEARIVPSSSLQAVAMTALTFLDGAPSPSKTRSISEESASASSSAPIIPRTDPAAQFKSSFAPSQSAAERRAKAEEAERQRDETLTKPGRARVKARPSGRWSGSSEEDEEDDQEPDDESPQQKQTSTFDPSRPSEDEIFTPSHSQASLGRGHPGRPLPDPSGPARRSSRNLPPIPGTGDASRNVGGPRAVSLAMPPSSSHPPSGNRSSSFSAVPQGNWDSSSGQGPLMAPAPRPPARTSMWNSSLDAPHLGPDDGNNARKFVEIEPPAQLTKAFTPHGLLQAGLQDKEDRSARKQEEVARETGSSLVNVPNKPPPPQTGLLGAITAHERDRSGAGGIGAALTERERDRRLAEERQRQIDDLETLQRQQMYSQQGQYAPPMSQQGGYGGMNPMQFNPAMMWGGGFNPYLPPQQQQQAVIQQQAMLAAQQAYQSAMYALSMAGSQAGDAPPGNEDRPASPASNMPPMPPMMPPIGMGMGMGMPFGSPYMTPYMTPPMMGSGSPMMMPYGYGGFPPQQSQSPGMPQGAQIGQHTLGSRVPSLQLNREGDGGPIPKQATGEGARGSPKPRVS